MKSTVKDFIMTAFWGALWASIITFLGKNWDTLTDAPLVFAGSLSIGGLIGWGAAQLYNRDRIKKWKERKDGLEERLKGKDEDIQRKNEQITELKEKLSTELNPELRKVSETQNEITENQNRESETTNFTEKSNSVEDSNIEEITVEIPKTPRSLEEIRNSILITIPSQIKIEKMLREKTEKAVNNVRYYCKEKNWSKEETDEYINETISAIRSKIIYTYKPIFIELSQKIRDELEQKEIDFDVILNEDINSLEDLLSNAKYLREDVCEKLKSAYTR